MADQVENALKLVFRTAEAVDRAQERVRQIPLSLCERTPRVVLDAWEARGQALVKLHEALERYRKAYRKTDRKKAQ